MAPGLFTGFPYFLETRTRTLQDGTWTTMHDPFTGNHLVVFLDALNPGQIGEPIQSEGYYDLLETPSATGEPELGHLYANRGRPGVRPLTVGEPLGWHPDDMSRYRYQGWILHTSPSL